MFPFNNPTFWEYVGAVLVAVVLAPFVYLLYVVARAVYEDRKIDYRSSASSNDPVFGELQFFKSFGSWKGEGTFAAIQSGVTIWVDAAEDGPTAEQRALYRQIEQKYNDLLPEIHKALAQYVEHDWEFDLGILEISDDTRSERWTAEYHAETEEDGDMMYEVKVVNWVVSDVTGSD